MPTPTDFLFEMWMLAKQSRTWFAYLWSGTQSIAEHTNRVCYVWYILAHMDGTADPAKVVMMCLFHDVTEARSLDHNYMAQSYVNINETKILDDQTHDLPGWDMLKDLVHEYEVRQSLESKLAKDADNLELLLMLKEQLDTGNTHAQLRINECVGRIRTDAGKQLLEQILSTKFDNRWRIIAKDTASKKDWNRH